MIRALNVSTEEGFDSRKTLSPFLFTHREDKSLRHVAMVAKFRNTTNRKRHLKSEFALFQTSTISFSFI